MTRKPNACISVVRYAPAADALDAARGLLAAGAADAAKHAPAPLPPPNQLGATEEDLAAAAALRATFRLAQLDAALHPMVHAAFPPGACDPRTAARAMGAWELVEWGITRHLHLGEPAHGAHAAAPSAAAGAAEAGIAGAGAVVVGSGVRHPGYGMGEHAPPPPPQAPAAEPVAAAGAVPAAGAAVPVPPGDEEEEVADAAVVDAETEAVSA
jgi:pilus assembly protein FimV